MSGHRHTDGVTNIVLNHERAAFVALEHLAGLGHKRIAFIKGQAFSSDTAVRWRAIRAGAQRIGLAVDTALVTQLEGDDPSPDLGYHTTRRLLESGREFTALFAFNDISAIGAIRALREAGRRVPEDVSVVGFDDIQSAEFQNPGLTTVRQPLRRMGELAAQNLLKRVEQRNGTGYPRTVSVDPELIVRGTTRVTARRRTAREEFRDSAVPKFRGRSARILSDVPRKPSKPSPPDLPLLKDRIRPGVRVLLVGINPGVRSALTGHHFAGYSNRFWKLLADSGLVPVPITYQDDDRLPEWGFGLTNLVPRPTRGIDELTASEYVAGRRALERKIRRYAPRIVALIGLTLARSLLRETPRLVGTRGERDACGAAAGESVEKERAIQRSRRSRIAVGVARRHAGLRPSRSERTQRALQLQRDARRVSRAEAYVDACPSRDRPSR